MELNKYIKSVSIEIERSEIRLASYNPRTISDEARKNIKRGIKKYGLVGGIIVNKQTGMTLVSGHQRLSVMDELNKFPDNDYILRVDLIDVDQTSEKELNILLNNPNAMGNWDFDALRELIPDINYKDAGLNEEDLNIIGVDFFVETEAEALITSDIDDMYAPIKTERDKKIAHNKEVKAKVKEKAEQKAKDMDAYVTLSFDDYQAKAYFMKRFGYDKDDKFIKGELFSEQVERIE